VRRARLCEHRDDDVAEPAREERFGAAPYGTRVGGGDQADDGVGPAQALAQPAFPVLSDGQAVAGVLVNEDVVAVAAQPFLEFAGTDKVLTRVTVGRSTRFGPLVRHQLPQGHVAAVPGRGGVGPELFESFA
jgi:hypothetical protein